MLKLSVIIPLYKAEKYIYQTMESILGQSYGDYEVIIVDDCGNDCSLDIIEKFHDPRIKIIHNNKNMGIAYSRNRGLHVACGEYVALMDDDDISAESRFKREIDFLDEHKEIDAVCSDMRFIDANGKIMPKTAIETFMNPYREKAEMMFRLPIPNASSMFRIKVVNDHNIVYKDGWLGMEDYRFWTDFAKYGEICSIGDILYYWRFHDENETNRAQREQNIERSNLFARLQAENIYNNGFCLSNEEVAVFNKVFPEEKNSFVYSKQDLEKARNVLIKIIKQSSDSKIKDPRSVEFACKRHYGRLTEQSEIWI